VGWDIQYALLLLSQVRPFPPLSFDPVMLLLQALYWKWKTWGSMTSESTEQEASIFLGNKNGIKYVATSSPFIYLS
jgi:hypothetical protein